MLLTINICWILRIGPPLLSRLYNSYFLPPTQLSHSEIFSHFSLSSHHFLGFSRCQSCFRSLLAFESIPPGSLFILFFLLILSFDARPICCYCVTGTWSALSINTQNRFRIHSRRVCTAWLFADEISKPPIAFF